ncbi:hypothetical protein U9M48_002197 [Paspalum notatum var. saurae]|uniref:NB-ARC domain-containing protein n=1 Tax=Paspalum notatum var. saurae TaxID=547442 RepID=A0AAQ3PQV5_PASNO
METGALHKLRRIVESINDLVTEMNAFGFNRHHQVINNNAPTQEDYWKWREMDSIMVDPENIVTRSREEERKKIIEILINGQASNGDDLLVVPIVGMGGLGKTTLAQLIYNDPQVQEHFHQLRKWVCVSNDFNVQSLANKICNSWDTSRDGALKNLQEQLSGKKYCRIDDDCDKEIAQFMGTVTDNLWANKYHDVQFLQNKFIQEIIKAKVGFSGLPKSKQDELDNLVGPIVERCGGSPMAAKALGSVLHNKTSKQEWEDVLQRSSICSYETGILPILNLSYDDLPSPMRQCFAFCALYPKTYHIDVHKLIQLWMANGFIIDKNAEIVGEQIVKQMVSRSFFEYVYQEPIRYLDLSGSDIKALPDDISILYSLQTLKLSGCKELNKLPQQMKYMTSLRHLYTDECYKLECMPPELGKLTSLRTVTCFVVGCGSYCSSLGELKNLDIRGSLEINHLENVTAAMNAKMANLRDKKELRQLSLGWTCGKEEEKQCYEVLEALRTHAGLLALEISFYQGTCFPSWLGMLRSMVELRLFICRKIEQLPLLCQLPELQLLELVGLEKLQFLCSDCTSSTLGKLKDLRLSSLDNFERFCQGGQGKLVAFPQLQILRIGSCKKLTALPEAPVLRESYGGGDYTMTCSAFPRLKILELSSLCSFERWGAALATEVKHPLFPVLETVSIWSCPQLATLPGAPKLRELRVSQENQRMSLGAATAGYLTSLSTLSLWNFNVDGKEKWDDHMSSSVTGMRLTCCDGLFFESRALALWSCFGQQLQDLTIKECSDLVHWPDKEFRS